MPEANVVKVMFSKKLKDWEAIKARWVIKCQGIQHEKRLIQAKRDLVADARPLPTRKPGLNPAIADAKSLGPAGTSTEDIKSLDAVEIRAKKCAESLQKIDKVISKLQAASRTARFSHDYLVVSVNKEQKLTSARLGQLSRGEEFEVISVTGRWWLVKTRAGIQGWVDGSLLWDPDPIELSSKPGVTTSTQDNSVSEALVQGGSRG